MDYFFGIMQISSGLLMSLIGFKIINPFKGSEKPEKEIIWYKKFGLIFKITGILVIFLGIAIAFLL